MTDDAAAAWPDLVLTRLSPQRAGVVLEPAEPEADPAAIGALSAFGYTVRGHDVRVTAYVFPEWGADPEAPADLEGRAREAGRLPLWLSTGPLLVVFTADPADEMVLYQLSSAFSSGPGG